MWSLPVSLIDWIQRISQFYIWIIYILLISSLFFTGNTKLQDWSSKYLAASQPILLRAITLPKFVRPSCRLSVRLLTFQIHLFVRALSAWSLCPRILKLHIVKRYLLPMFNVEVSVWSTKNVEIEGVGTWKNLWYFGIFVQHVVRGSFVWSLCPRVLKVKKRKNSYYTCATLRFQYEHLKTVGITGVQT